jgi:hypothetical protein
VAQAHVAGYHVSVLPLKPDYAAAFDEKAFWAWFATVQGMPYGYHSLLDTFMGAQPVRAARRQ